MKKVSLRSALENNQFVTAPGIQDMITAVIANKIGFDFVYASGYWSTASTYGLPDAGIASYTQILDRVAMLAKRSNASVIADADTGYGGLLNVHHTIRGYEEAGVVAVHLEDQEFPKKCGHTPFKRVVSTEEMVDKIKVACEARRNPQETLIIARTDARAPESFARAVDRAAAYGDAGADVVFVEALHSQQEMREACAAIDKPMIANMASGGKTPILTVDELEDIGYSMAIFPALASLACAAAAEKALLKLKLEGSGMSSDVPLFDFNEFNSLIGFDQVWALEEKWQKTK
ncbi:MAG: isocitrate lyase/PEP mutase family protein [Acidiferrobacterales bacterium]|nr:isocitrate lyase/PEP mutase family protein [Acidiferrobacterales bacterium]